MSTNKKTSVPFQGTKEQEKELLAALKELKGTQGATMLALQKAQQIYGYLPYEVQRIIAEELGVSMEDTYGVSTFYSLFTLNPKGKYKVSVCLGTPCYILGAAGIEEEVLKQLQVKRGGITNDRKFSVDVIRCIGACAISPAMMINDDTYGKLTPEKVAGILAKYE